ncbi:hypothetical protein MXAN_2130 [Myxococcus xanthus DK 1622]|uniref:Uncharacterized protein n=1 Tax=Myxococcus xanthus (strain DK1622) TaxID=246197 RepID=Q1DAG9_MYXXD|nr:hypothetical protein MXAN_2130 [Myxococcus xanthus DK 1622]
MVRPRAPPSCATSSRGPGGTDPSQLTVWKERLYFVVSLPWGGITLYVSDGTAAGTLPHAVIAPEGQGGRSTWTPPSPRATGCACRWCRAASGRRTSGVGWHEGEGHQLAAEAVEFGVQVVAHHVFLGLVLR